MREVQARLGEDIQLGRRGENLAVCVTFDVGDWPGATAGTVHLLHQRNGDDHPYPCAITVEGGVATWVITAADVAVAGRGRAELQYLEGETCIKSATYTTNTLRALGRAGEAPPEPEAGWVSQVLKAGGSTLENATAAHTSELNAKASEEAAKAAQKAAEEARDASQAIVGGDYVTDEDLKQVEANANAYTDNKIKSIPAPDVSGQIEAHNTDAGAHANIREYVDRKIEAIPTPDVSGQINAHNTNDAAHADIRMAVSAAQAAVADKAPMYTYGTEDLTAGSSPLETGKMHVVYE